MLFSYLARLVEEHPVRAATFAGLFQQFCSAGSAVLLFPFIVSSLSGADSGLWFAFQGFVAISGLCDFGLGFVVARQTSYSLSQSSRGNLSGDFIDFGLGGAGVRRMRAHVERIYRISGSVAIIVGVIIYEWILPLTKTLDGATEHSRTVWYLMLCTGLFLLMANRWISILNGAHNVFTARMIFGGFFLLQGISVTLAAVYGQSLLPMAVLSMIVAMIYCVSAKFAATRTVPALREMITESTDSELVKRLWRISVPVGCTNTSSFLVSSVQVPALAAIFGPAYVAPFYLAQKLLQFGSMIAQQPIASQLARFTGALSAGKKESANKIMKRSLGFLLPMSLLAGLGFVVVSPGIAALLAPEKVYPNFLVLSLMALNMVFLSVAAVCGQFVMASGKNPFMWVTLANGFMNLLVLCLLVPNLGLLGIPLGALVTGCLSSYSYSLYRWNMLRQNFQVV